MGDPRCLSRAVRATSSSYYRLLCTFSVTVVFSVSFPWSTPLTFPFLLLSPNLNITSKARYHSGARSEGCGPCSVPKHCETRGYGGRVHLSWRQKPQGYQNIARILVHAGYRRSSSIGFQNHIVPGLCSSID